MKGSQLAVAGGVFVAVLVACFALVGFSAKGEATAKPDPTEGAPPASPAVVPAPPGPPLPSPRPPAVALGGFGAVAQLERGYDGTAALTRSSASGSGQVARWTAPASDRDTFDLRYRDARLVGSQFVTVTDTEVRVRSARTGETTGSGYAVAKHAAAPVLSPDGEWAVQVSGDRELTVIDTAAGTTTAVKLDDRKGQSFAGGVGFDPRGHWAVVTGKEKDDHVLFRVRKGGGPAERVAPLGNEGTTSEYTSIERVVPLADGRYLLDRPGPLFRDRRFQVWSPDTRKTVTLPVTAAQAAEFREYQVGGKWLALFAGPKLLVLDIPGGRVHHAHDGGKFRIGAVAFGPTGDRLVVAYRLWHSGLAYHFGFGAELTEPGHVWVLDLPSREPVGKTFGLAGVGVTMGFARCLLSADGSRLAVVERDGQFHLIDADRAFGPGTLAERPAAPASPADPGPAPDTRKPTTGFTDS